MYKNPDQGTIYAHYFDDFLKLEKHSNTKYLKLVPELVKSGAMCMLTGWFAGAASGEGRVPPAFPLICRHEFKVVCFVFFSTKPPVFTCRSLFCL